MLSEKARKKAEEAKQQSKWLYDPSYNKWYEPENFLHVFNYALANDEFVDQLQVKHPSEGIEAGFKKVIDLQEKVKVFALRVTDYYKRRL